MRTLLVTPPHPDPSARAEWLNGWRIVAAATCGMMMGAFHAYSIGTMTAPLEAQFGWSRTQITSGLLITSALSVLLSPFMGMAIDRVSPRRIGLGGIVFYCTALGSLSLATPSLWMWWALWTFVGLGQIQIKTTVWAKAITHSFERSRGMALAVMLSATAIGQAFVPATTYFLIEHFGWRGAYVGLACLAAAISLPIVFFWFRTSLDNARHARAQGPLPAAAATGLGVRESLLSPTFLRLALAAVVMGTAGTALTVNLVPTLSSLGLSRGLAASVAGLSGVFAIIGRLGGGYLLDRFDARLVGAGSVLLPIVSCGLLLAFPGHLAWAIVAVICIGLSAGAEMDAITYLSGRCFGQRNFGTLFGALSGLLTLGLGLGPALGNVTYDMTGSYEIFLVAVIPMSFIAAWLFFTVGPYPNFAATSSSAQTQA
jgi:MFS family permease